MMLASACGCWNFWELEFLPAFGWSGAAEKHSRTIYCTADCHHSFGRKSDFACLTLRCLVRVGGLSLKTRVDFCMLICLCFWSCTMDMDDVKTSTKIIWPLKSTVSQVGGDCRVLPYSIIYDDKVHVHVGRYYTSSRFRPLGSYM